MEGKEQYGKVEGLEEQCSLHTEIDGRAEVGMVSALAGSDLDRSHSHSLGSAEGKADAADQAGAEGSYIGLDIDCMAADMKVGGNAHSPAGSLGSVGDCDHMAWFARSFDRKTGCRNPAVVQIAVAIAAADYLLHCSLRSHSRWDVDHCSSLGSTYCQVMSFATTSDEASAQLEAVRRLPPQRDKGFITSTLWKDGN